MMDIEGLNEKDRTHAARSWNSSKNPLVTCRNCFEKGEGEGKGSVSKMGLDFRFFNLFPFLDGNRIVYVRAGIERKERICAMAGSLEAFLCDTFLL